MAVLFQAPLLDVDSERSTTSRRFKVGWGMAFIGGSCLVLLSVVAIFSYGPIVQKTNVADQTSLIGMPSSLRLGQKSSAMLPVTLRNLPGAGPWKDLAVAGLQSSGRCDRDVSFNANGIKSVLASMSGANRAVVAKAMAKDVLKAGQTAPFGFWDPLGLSTDLSEGKLLFYREAEIKHGRVCMLAFLGIFVGEQFHPLFGGNIDVASTKVFTQVSLSEFWPLAAIQFLIMSGYEEIRSSRESSAVSGTFYSGLVPNDSDEGISAPTGRLPGDLGFDPLGLKPKDEKDLLAIQNKEINNGRLAMIAVAGLVAQEMVTGAKTFGT